MLQCRCAAAERSLKLEHLLLLPLPI